MSTINFAVEVKFYDFWWFYLMVTEKN